VFRTGKDDSTNWKKHSCFTGNFEYEWRYNWCPISNHDDHLKICALLVEHFTSNLSTIQACTAVNFIHGTCLRTSSATSRRQFRRLQAWWHHLQHKQDASVIFQRLLNNNHSNPFQTLCSNYYMFSNTLVDNTIQCNTIQIKTYIAP